MGERSSKSAVAGLLAALAALLLAAPASADLTTLKASCTKRDAADDNTSNGIRLPYVFCDDGVPPTGGVVPNNGAVDALAVPERYGGDGYTGLPPKTSPDPNTGADANGDIALDADVTLPDPSRFPPPPGGYPLIVMMHGCCSGNKTGWESPTIDDPDSSEGWHYNNAWFASQGYVVLTYTARGFVDGHNRGSTGVNELDSRRYEMNDFQYLAGLLADDPFFHVDPRRVVATGGSYGGGFSWLAMTDPTWNSPGGKAMNLAAVAPRYGWTDLVNSLVPAGRQLGEGITPTDGSSDTSPFGMPKRSVVGALYGTGNMFNGNHTIFPPEMHQAFACVQGPTPQPSSPLCQSTIQSVLPQLMHDSSAYYQNQYFDRLASGDPAAVVPVFVAGTLTDPLFTSIETRRMVNRLKSIDPNYPVQQYYGDYNHFVQDKRKEWTDLCGSDHHSCTVDDPPSAVVATGITTRLDRFVDHYVRPQGDPSQPTPAFDVTASLQICPENASGAFPLDQPGQRFTAPTFEQLAPDRLTVPMTGTQTTSNAASPNQNAAAADPVLNLATNGSHCPVTHASNGAATAGPGVATYDSPPLPRDYTMIGATKVTVPHTGSGSDLQLDARLYDLFPDGTQVMVDRGPRRVLDANETTAWELHGAGWRFPAGHRIRIEIAQDDDPFVQASNVPSSLTLQGATLSIPVRQPSATITGGVAARPGRRASRAMRIAVKPRRVRAGRRTTFTFKVTTVVNGKRRPVRGVLIRFRGHKARTGRRGRAHIRAKLRRAGRYRASATRAGYRRASVRVRAMRAHR